MTDSAWRSKVDAEAPIGASDQDYIAVLQAFHDKIYVPSATKPKDTDVEMFLKTPDAQVPGVDPGTLRKIIGTGFRIEKTLPSAARESAEIRFQPNAQILQPKDGVDQVFVRKENIYVPADSRLGDLPEGLYAPVNQYEPRDPGTFDDKSTSWTQSSFFSVCKEGEPCAKNVL